MLKTIFFLAVTIWMLGLSLQFGGSVFHLLAVVAAIMLVMKHTLHVAPCIEYGHPWIHRRPESSTLPQDEQSPAPPKASHLFSNRN
jgi:hypothetical protein